MIAERLIAGGMAADTPVATFATLRKEMAKTMEEGCGIYRQADTMQATCDKIAELRQRAKRTSIL